MAASGPLTLLQKLHKLRPNRSFEKLGRRTTCSMNGIWNHENWVQEGACCIQD